MSMLRRAVFVELVLFALVPLNDAACWNGFLKKDGTHCQDSVDRTWHAVGSAWTNSRCDKCECTTHYMACCNGMPKVYITGDCTVVYDYDTCTFDVIFKDDGTVPCSARSSGK
ncbi:hypothetical protein AOLI_G00069230 [Acnodon oligacanthus]